MFIALIIGLGLIGIGGYHLVTDKEAAAIDVVLSAGMIGLGVSCVLTALAKGGKRRKNKP